jgi:hypothetical protein
MRNPTKAGREDIILSFMGRVVIDLPEMIKSEVDPPPLESRRQACISGHENSKDDC